MLVSSSLPNLIGGVSQQPPALRVTNSHEALVNTWPSIVSGLQKRPGTRVVKKIGAALGTSVAQHVYNDPVSGQTFFILATDNSIRVFNQNGQEKTVSGTSGVAYLNFAGNPKRNCRMLTVGDTTFLLNRTVVTKTNTVTETGDRVSANPNNRWTIFISEAVPNAYYTLYINNTQAATLLTNNNVDASHAVQRTSEIAESMRSQLAAISGVTATRYNSTVGVTLPSGFSLSVYNDGDAGDAMKVWSTTVDDFSDLPPQEQVGRILKVTGDPSDTGDDYYVQYGDDGRWKECYGLGAGLSVDNTTMPYTLTYEQESDTFVFAQHSWGGRLVGDNTTSPPPTIFGQTINNVTIYRGRMCFLADENVLFSEADNYENFWRTTVVQLLDDDPIDLAVVSGRVSILNHAVPFNKKLVLFADQAQYILDSPDILSPKTAVASFTTAFTNSIIQSPINIGPYVYFLDDSGSYLRLMEFFTDNNAQTENADDSSVQVPQFMKGPVEAMTGTPRLNAALIQGSDPNTLYTYRFMFGDDSKIMSSWGEWSFLGAVQAYEFVDNYLYLFVNYSDGLYLERMLLEEDAVRTLLDFPVDLDHQITLDQCSPHYDADSDTTTFTTPYAYDDTVTLVTAPGASDAGVQYQLRRTTGNTFVADGDLTAETDAIIGMPYEFLWELSPQYVRETKGSGTVVIQDGRLSLRYLSLQYRDTSAFTVRVIVTGGKTYEYVFEGRTLGSENNILGSVSIENGTFRVPIMAQNTNVTIQVVNSTPYHCTFTTAEWQGQWRAKSIQRV